jgi:hypothetical protein
MRKSLVFFLFLVAVTLSASADGFFCAEGFSAGTTVLRFQGSHVMTTFEGPQEVRGTLTLDDVTYPFVASGSAFGIGMGDTAVFAANLWVLFSAAGTVDGVDPITIRGGADVTGEEIDLDSFSLGSGAGTFFFIVEFRGTSYEFTGSVRSTASGSLVPPRVPSTMEISGSVTSTFEGTLTDSGEDLTDQLPWDASSWPDGLHEQLLTLLLTGVMPESDEESEPAEEPRPRGRGRDPSP